MAQGAAILKPHGFYSAAAESVRPLLKEMHHATSSQQNAGYQEAMLNSVLLCIELLSKLSQLLCGVPICSRGHMF